MRALDLYYLLNRRAVNFGNIISNNMDEMAQSQSKKYLGHVIDVLLLCRQAGVPEFINGHIMNPAQPLDTG